MEDLMKVSVSFVYMSCWTTIFSWRLQTQEFWSMFFSLAILSKQPNKNPISYFLDEISKNDGVGYEF